MSTKKCISLLTVLVLLSSMAPFIADQTPVFAGDNRTIESISPELAGQMAEYFQQKQALTATQRKIDSHLNLVVRNIKERVAASPPGQTLDFRDLTTPMLKIDGAGNIEVRLDVNSLTPKQLGRLENLGMNVSLNFPKYGVVEGSVPYNRIEAIAALDFISHVETPSYPIYYTGAVNSAGDTVLRAAEARADFGVDGSGFKIGVMSNGVNHLANSVASGDLPSSPAVEVLQDRSGDEGTAMLEIIHDLAPGAELAFYAPASPEDMAAGILALEGADCDIIVDDIGWSNEPKFEDGLIAQTARGFVERGGVYASSAGNAAMTHYQAPYNRGVIQLKIGGTVYNIYAHDYGAGDTRNDLTLPSGATIIVLLQWNNEWGASGDDFDLFLVSGTTILTGSGEEQSGSGDPLEGMSYTNTTASDMMVSISVLEYSLASPPGDMVLDYHVWYGPPMEYYTPVDSVIGHSAVEEVLSTAAARVTTPDTIEFFSSRGPAKVYYPAYEERQVPNITGVDGVETRTGQLGYFANPFYGTSASAPHVAAIAALVWDANPGLTSSEVFNAITSTAVDMPPSGWDGDWGFGRADAYLAVESVYEPLSVTTNDADNIATDSARLHGTLDSLGIYGSADVSFEWGTTSGALDHETTPETLNSDGDFSKDITGLTSNTEYFFQAKAVAGGDEIVYGSELSFITEKASPAVTTHAADNITARSATLNGNLDSKGDYASANVCFEWGPDTGYGNETPLQLMPATGPFKDDISGLDPGTTYHFRAKSVTGAAFYGDDETFTTCIPGDANDDGVVDYLDLTEEKQIIFGELPPTCGADANEDDDINILDLVKIILIILGP